MILDDIWRTERERNQTEQFYDKLIKKTRNAKKFKEAEEIEEEAAHMVHECETRLNILYSRALVREAWRLRVPVPEHSDKEMWENLFGFVVLTTKGYATVRSDIRKEKKERSERWISLIKDVVIPLGSFLIGILSLLVAYAALHLKH